MKTIVRSGSFDSMHRVMNEKMKCFNVHGHTYLYELRFSFDKTEDIGYALDFKEIKRVFMQFIDDSFDHGAILNPKDEALIKMCEDLGSKIWIMGLNGAEYCNPSVENIALEIFLCIDRLCRNSYKGLVQLESIKINETPNCYTTIDRQGAFSDPEQVARFYEENGATLDFYSRLKGTIEYDDRKQQDPAGV